MENNILTVKRNNKLELQNMVRQYTIKGLVSLGKGWDEFMYRSGRLDRP